LLSGTNSRLAAFAALCFVLLTFSGVSSASSGVTFGSAQNLSNNAGASTAPVVATVTDGTNRYVYVAWEDTSNGGRNTFFQRSTDGGSTWGSVIVFTGLSGKANVQTSAVQIAAEGQYVFLTWTQGKGTAFAASSDYGADFYCGSSPGACMISGSAPAGQMSGQAIAASGSNVYVSWADDTNDGQNLILFTSSSDAGVTFSPFITLNSGTPFSHGEDELAASGSYVYAVWDLIYFSASSDNGATWSTPIQMIPSTCTFPCIGREPMISVSGSNVYVTFPMGGFHGASSYSAIVNVSPDNGASWTQINLSDAYLSNIREVQVSSYGDNVYVTSRGTSTGVKGVQQYVYVSNNDGVTWSAPVRLADSPQPGAENGFGGFAVDQTTGAVYVQWPHGNPQQLFLSASQDNGASWSTPQQVSQSSNGVVSMGDPSGGQGPMAAAGNGYLFVVWEDLSTGNGDIYFAAVTPS